MALKNQSSITGQADMYAAMAQVSAFSKVNPATPLPPINTRKLRIEAYRDDQFKVRTGVFIARINPSSYSHNHSIQLATGKTDAAGSPGASSKFGKVNPEQVSFEIMFDGTGVIPGCTDVLADIQALKRCTFYYDGELHRPSYLKLVWGKNFTRSSSGEQFFTCQLKSLNFTYTLFKPDGYPLRAKANIQLEEFRTASAIAADARKSSPDMTHTKVVRIGDTLPMLCYAVYKDPAYYLEIAKINNLTNFRNLKPGTVLTFPPIEK